MLAGLLRLQHEHGRTREGQARPLLVRPDDQVHAGQLLDLADRPTGHHDVERSGCGSPSLHPGALFTRHDLDGVPQALCVHLSSLVEQARASPARAQLHPNDVLKQFILL